jgi:hypothetical protein
VGGNYKVYVETLSDLVSFEVHYVRRGWRPPRPRRFFEKLWAFGETLKLVKGDNVYWTVQDEQVHIGQVSHCGRRDVAVTVEVCGSSTGKNAPTGITICVHAVAVLYLHARCAAPKDTMLRPNQVHKLVPHIGKGPALSVGISQLREYLKTQGDADVEQESKNDEDTLDGNIIISILDARHKITATDYYWETIMGVWWSGHDGFDPYEDDKKHFDDSLDYVQLSQNLAPPSQLMAQKVRSGFSFTSLLPGMTGCAVSGGSGSTMRIPLGNAAFEHFISINESFLSTVEDFTLSMLMMYYDKGRGAHIADYSMTIAKYAG